MGESPATWHSEAMLSSEDPCGVYLQRIQRGDEAAFEELYRGQAGILLACILRIINNRSLAEEVLQDVFAEIWTHSDGFDPSRGSGRAWLVTMSRRRAIDRVRAVQAQQNRDFAEGVKAIHSGGEDVQGEALLHVESAQAAEALRRLPDEQSAPIAMAYYQDMSHREISENLGVPLGTIKSRIRDGMRRLRTQLGVNDERRR